MSNQIESLEGDREALEFRVTDTKKRVPLFEALSDGKAPEVLPTTVLEVFNKTAEQFPDRMALMSKNEVTNEWGGITFRMYKQQVERIAKVFIKLGLENRGIVAVFAFNCAEWLISELAAIHAGGVISGIYLTSSIEACFHILDSSRANICVVDGKDQMEMIRKIKHKLPHLKAIIQIHSSIAHDASSVDDCWSWSDLEDVKIDDVEDEYQSRLRNVAVNECCCLVYTSGTVGNPKGVMLSHDNLMFDAQSSISALGNIEMGQEVFVSYLPLSHLAAQMADVFFALTIAATVYFADRDALKSSLLETLVAAQPTFFLGVPRVFEKIHERMLAVGAQAGFVKKCIGKWAKRVTLEHHMNRLNGSPTNSLQFRIAQMTILGKVRQALGFKRCKGFLTGAAPISEATRNYFLSLDMPLIEGYGMTESSSVHLIGSSMNPSAGKSLPGTETKIINKDLDGHGEICMRGRHVFMGYINEPEKSIEAIDNERWLHSGDLGYIDDNGFVHVTGRIKELIITSGGENIPYLCIENQVKCECSAISNAMLVGDKRKFLTILVTLKTEFDENGFPSDDLDQCTKSWLNKINLNYTKLSEILASGPDEKVLLAIHESINRANGKSASNAHKVQKFAILPHDFTIATGELTATMKLKRNFVLNKFTDLIESFYDVQK